MPKRSEQTRQALVRATAGIIANGRLSDAGLVNICQSAGVSRGALYHHFSSTAELTAAVYGQAYDRTATLAEEAFEGPVESAAARFSASLCTALRDEELVRAGMRLAADGSAGPPGLRDEALDLVHRHLTEAGGEMAELADLAVVVTAGLESLGHTDGAWWEPRTSERIWNLLRPLFGPRGPVRGGGALGAAVCAAGGQD
ncbi:TetR family transcriptional regulator [Streptomyces sp. NBC_01565]|uniref:TetR family transcriptional regulator n=1 Tax=unclassified Streptomyces TaxID=2593676 RepID=UPI002254CC78|nr:TetR family transcriptional regulator [Streptomyces sp. NBC_01565]MCX4545911.1 TetR family transcriptional regulator [Streptomyces sp. NBC_01565]